LWSRVLFRYPSLIACFRNSSVADIPGQLYYTGRLQRCMDRLYGNRWIALNHTAGFIDPLHSTGIAHTLSGLERLLEIFISSCGSHKKIYSGLEKHQASFFRELQLIDLLVSGCYMSRNHFKLFHAYSMVYFACTINYEQKRLSGSIPYSFLDTGDEKIREMVSKSYRELTELLKHDLSEKTIEKYINRIRGLIKPYNTAGLLKKNKLNMYSHTAVELDNC
jgi:tetracycline 7-halogenase / FADH2 O2-dependent halogenase